MNNATVLKLLTPIELGGDDEALRAAEGAGLDRAKAAIDALENEMHPSTATLVSIADWERNFGLTPAPTATLAERRMALSRKFQEAGGNSRAYFIGLAAVYGLDITITEYLPSRCGILRAGEKLYVEAVTWEWTVTAPAAFQTYGLDTVFAKLKPAHTLVNFIYY